MNDSEDDDVSDKDEVEDKEEEAIVSKSKSAKSQKVKVHTFMILTLSIVMFPGCISIHCINRPFLNQTQKGTRLVFPPASV